MRQIIYLKVTLKLNLFFLNAQKNANAKFVRAITHAKLLALSATSNVFFGPEFIAV